MKYLKIGLVVASLLLTGFFAGFHTHRYLATRKIRQVAELRLSRGFQTRFFETVQASEEQKKALEPIVEEYAGKMADIHQAFRKERQAVVDSLLIELKPHLDEVQRRQLEKFNRPFRGRKPNGDWRKGQDQDASERPVRE